MPVERVAKRLPSSRIAALARRLLDASTLCAIATVSPGGRAHVNTAYFAYTAGFDIVWLSAPEARHSRNVRAGGSAAVAVFRSTQTWGNPDRGIQVFGTARELAGRAALDAERAYAARFRAYDCDTTAYRFYRLRPRALKLFDERVLGGGTFLTARLGARGPVWERTERYTGE